MDVDTIRSGLEAYRNGLELDSYELDRGLRPESEARAIRQSYTALFAAETRTLLEGAIAKAKERGLDDDVHTLGLLRAGLIRSHVARELSPIDAAISRHGRVVFIELSDGSRRPLRDMKLLLADTPNRARRGEVEAARTEQAEILIPLMTEKVGIEQAIAQDLGQPNLVDLHHAVSGVDPRAVAAQAREILEETADLYREVMGWNVRKRIGVPLADASRGDIPFVLAGRYADYKEAFTAKSMIRLAKDFLRRMGIELTGNGNLTIEVESPGGPPRAYVGAIRVPDDIRLVLEVSDGQRDWLTFLEALGRALFLSHMNPEAPFEQRGLGDHAIDLAHGALFKHLLLDPRWLERSLEFTRSKDYLILAYLERLYDLRLCCGRVLFDVQLREKASAEGMDDVYEDIMRQAIGVSSPRPLFLHDVRTPLHAVTQLRARLFEPLLTLHLLHYFDDTWWANPRAGPFLNQEWLNGRRYAVEELAKGMGYELDSKPLLKLFAKHL
jgi:hypothetical protein